jgi:hypothetical protein
MVEKITDFKIVENGSFNRIEYYIFSKSANVYLQATGILPYFNCANGWFKTREDAQKCLDKYMGKNTLNLPERIPQPPKLPEGYEYVDRGWGWVQKDVRYAYCYDKCKWDIIDHYANANGIEEYYYLEIVKKENKEKIMNLEEQIKFAKSLVGKKVKSRNCDGYFLIERFEIYTEETKHDSDLFVEEFKKTISKQPAYVCLIGEQNYERIILPNSKPEDFEIQKEVKVNGHIAEDMGDYYKFGCAEISKPQLKRAKEFLVNSQGCWNNSNRDTKSVKIGAGEFTLEILNQLV